MGHRRWTLEDKKQLVELTKYWHIDRGSRDIGKDRRFFLFQKFNRNLSGYRWAQLIRLWRADPTVDTHGKKKGAKDPKKLEPPTTKNGQLELKAPTPTPTPAPLSSLINELRVELQTNHEAGPLSNPQVLLAAVRKLSELRAQTRVLIHEVSILKEARRI